MKRLEPLAVAHFYLQVTRIGMYVMDVPRAISCACDRREYCGTQQISNLNSNVIVAVNESGKLDDSWILRRRLEFLRKDGMRNGYV